MVNRGRAQRTLLICIHRWKRPRMRRRRLPMSSSDPRRPRRDLGTTNRQDSTDAPAMAASSISRIKKKKISAPRNCILDLFGPRANRTPLKQLQCAFGVCMLVSYTAISGSCAIELDCQYSPSNRPPRAYRAMRATPVNAPLPHCICIGILIAG